MKVFKVRRKSDGLFSEGGGQPSFGKQGKSWKSIGPFKNHLHYLQNGWYDNCEIVEFELLETRVVDWSEFDPKPKEYICRVCKTKYTDKEKHFDQTYCTWACLNAWDESCQAAEKAKHQTQREFLVKYMESK